MKLLNISSLIIGFVVSIAHAQEKTNSTVKDIDGNIYKAVVIANFEWMAENLRVTKYNNGIEIPMVVGNDEWVNSKTGAYCWYNNSDSNATKFGALYNWYAVNTGNLCPIGWRVPSDEDWKYMEGYVDSKFKIGDHVWNGLMGRGSDIGLKLKTRTGWNFNGNGFDSLGFTAWPFGERSGNRGTFHHIGNNGFWWSNSEYDLTSAWYRCLLFFDERTIRNTHPKSMGFSVRCVKNI